ncbi:MAG: hypothetical protein V9E88_08690 [Ferruginibacter sp.]
MSLSGENVPADRSTSTGKILVTGASGLLGAELVNQLLFEREKSKSHFSSNTIARF